MFNGMAGWYAIRTPSQRVVAIAGRTVVGEIARRVVRPADGLVRGGVGVLCRARAVDPGFCGQHDEDVGDEAPTLVKLITGDLTQA
jgi:hypothetical protein